MSEQNPDASNDTAFEPEGYLKGIFVGKKAGVTWLNESYLDVIMRTYSRSG